MKSSQIPVVVTYLVLGALGVGCSPDGRPPAETNNVSVADAADTVYTNGRIYTVNEAQPWADAVALKNGKFLVVGSIADVEAVTGEATEVIDLGGRMAMPGLIDVHVHPLSVAAGWANVKIENPSDVDAMLGQIRDYVEQNPDVAMIRGEPWNLGVFPDDSPRKDSMTSSPTARSTSSARRDTPRG